MLVTDRRVVVTGKIAGESRQTAEAKLREAGAIIQSAVNKDTDILVTGASVGAKKRDAALALGVEVIPWEQAFGNGGGNYSAPAPRAPMPTVRQWAPMLCKAGTLPSGPGWVYEMKWDGIRGIATVQGGGVVLQSRSGKSDLTERYPQVVEELSGIPDCVLDGEIIVGSDSTPVYMVFDVLSVMGTESTGLTLLERRTLLETLFSQYRFVAISPLFEDGEVLLRAVTADGDEGVVAKRASSRYLEGGRGEEWIKVKVRREQEFIVLGYTDGEGARADTFGALVLGYYDCNALTYAGKVGTGFDDATLRMLLDEMEPHVWNNPRTHCPHEIEDKEAKALLAETTWLEPAVVVQVAFQRWTEDGMLWHPSYRGLRTDKQPHEVMRDTYVAKERS